MSKAGNYLGVSLCLLNLDINHQNRRKLPKKKCRISEWLPKKTIMRGREFHDKTFNRTKHRR